MGATGPVICHACWAKKDNHYDACECVKDVIESAKNRIAQQLTAKDATIAALREAVAEAKLSHRSSEATLSMAVARLEGLVEGRPTHRGNFLQRIDALREIELRATTAERELEAYKEAVRVLGNLVRCFREGVKNKTFIEHMDDRKIYDSCVDCNPLASSAVRGEQQRSPQPGTAGESVSHES